MERRIKGKVKGKAIIGIAVAAIMLASVMAVLPGMSEDVPIVIPVPPDGKIQIDLTQNIGKEVVLVAEQLTLAGTMLEIKGTEGVCEVKEVLLKVVVDGKDQWVSTEKLSYPLGMHTIKVAYENLATQKVLERQMKVRVVDTRAPAIDVGNNFISEGKTTFSIRVSDDCDVAPEVSAVIMLPCMDDLKIRQKEAADVEVEIDLKEMTAVLKGPAKVRAMMREKGMMQVMMNEKMLEQQEIVINLEKEVIKDGVKYKYKANGRTLEIEGYTDVGVTREMVVTAMDASGKVAEHKEMLALLQENRNVRP